MYYREYSIFTYFAPVHTTTCTNVPLLKAGRVSRQVGPKRGG